jgi:cell division septum initiation protein DivIVA
LKQKAASCFQKVKSANAKNDSTKILTEAKRKSAEILERANEKALHLTEEAKKEVWTCSMHPQIRMEEPGKCPICAIALSTPADQTQ